MKPRVLAGAAALALLAALPTQAQAPVAAAPAAGEDLTLSLGYDGRLYVKILQVDLEQSATRRGHQSRMNIRAVGPLAVFKRLDVNASSRGRLERGALKADVFNYTSKSGSKERTLQADWTPSDVVTNATPAFVNMGVPPATPAQKIAATDPLTQLLRMTLADHPCTGQAPMYDGKQRYNLNMSVIGPGELTGEQKEMGLKAPVLCQARYQKVAGFKPNKTKDEQDAVGMRDMEMGFARVGEDGPWVISSLTIDTGLGPAKLRLSRLKVTGGAAAVARLKSTGPG